EDFRLRLAQVTLVVAVAALLLVLQQHDGQQDRRDREQGEHAPEQDAQAERCHRRPRGLRHGLAVPPSTQRKPRMGTFSMQSKPGSTSRKASRMVLTCLRTFSRLRPLLTTSYSSS